MITSILFPLSIITMCDVFATLLHTHGKLTSCWVSLLLTAGVFALLLATAEPFQLFFLPLAALGALNGVLLYAPFARLCTTKQNRLCRLLLVCTFSYSSTLPIWIGDNNLQFVFLAFVVFGMLCTQGNRAGRLAVIFTFFCMELSVCTLLDSYLGSYLTSSILLNEIVTRSLRSLVFLLFYLVLRRIIPEGGIHLPESLWRLVLGLSLMPLCAFLSTVLLTYLPEEYETTALQQLQIRLGIAILPFVLLSSFAILLTMRVLANHEQLERARQLAELRESYYEMLSRQEQQVRHLRHDMRNHLIAMQGMLARGSTTQAVEYVNDLLDTQALHGGRRLCDNETANAVLSAKLDRMQQYDLQADVRVALPKQLAVAPPDLCALLGNALDNAIEAAKDASDRRIIVRCQYNKGMFMLRVVNAFSGERCADLRTTKPNKQLHGLGLAGMRDIVQRYGGTLDTVMANQTFELTACLIVEQH